MTDYVFDNRILARHGTAGSLKDTAKYRLSHLSNSLYVIRQPIMNCNHLSHVPSMVGISVQEMGGDAVTTWLPSQSCSKPAKPTWVFKRNIIVSPLSMWLEDHTNGSDQVVYPRWFRARPHAVCSFTYQCVVCMTVSIRTVESVSNLMNQSTT